MALFGMSEEEAKEKLKDDAHTAPLHLPSDLHPVIELAAHARGEWRFVPMGIGGFRAVSLDRQGVNTVAGWLDIKIDRQIAQDLQVIEDEALTLFGEKT